MHHRLASNLVRCDLVLYVDSKMVIVLSFSLLEKRFVMFGHPEASDPVWLRGRENPITNDIFVLLFTFLSHFCACKGTRACVLFVCARVSMGGCACVHERVQVYVSACVGTCVLCACVCRERISVWNVSM